MKIDAQVVTNIENMDATNSLSIYPVPAKDNFTIDLTSFNGDKNIFVEISDISGKRIKLVKATEDDLNFSSKNLGLNAGIYFIKASSEKRNLSAKILIE